MGQSQTRKASATKNGLTIALLVAVAPVSCFQLELVPLAIDHLSYLKFLLQDTEQTISIIQGQVRSCAVSKCIAQSSSASQRSGVLTKQVYGGDDY
jgi:hypothetical protein